MDGYAETKVLNVSSSPDGELTNCRKYIHFYFGAGESSDDVIYLNGGMLNPPYDIRFSDDEAGTSQLDFWRESYDGSGFLVCVKIPTVPASGGTVIYAHIGNAVATDASDGESTFDFFEDWDNSVSADVIAEVLATELGYGAEDRSGCFDSVNNIAYIYGGENGGSYYNTIQKFTPPSTLVTLTETLPDQMCRMQLSTIFNSNDGCAYLYGGYDAGGVRTEIVKHNISGESTSTLSEALSVGVSKPTAVFVPSANVTYIFGGLTTDGNTCTNKIWKHDITAGTCVEITATIPTPSGFDAGTGRAGMAAAYDAESGIIYLLGGIGTDGGSDENALDEILKFVISTETISLETYTLPYELDEAQAFFDATDDVIYFVGGYHWPGASNDQRFYSEKIIKIDPSEETVEIQKQTLPLGMDDYALVWDSAERIGYALGVSPETSIWNTDANQKKIVKLSIGSQDIVRNGQKFDDWHNPLVLSESIWGTHDLRSRAWLGYGHDGPTFSIPSDIEFGMIRWRWKYVGSAVSDIRVRFVAAVSQSPIEFSWSTVDLYEVMIRDNAGTKSAQVAGRTGNVEYKNTATGITFPRDGTWMVHEFKKVGTAISLYDEAGNLIVTKTDAHFSFSDGRVGFYADNGTQGSADAYYLDWIAAAPVTANPPVVTLGEAASGVPRHFAYYQRLRS